MYSPASPDPSVYQVQPARPGPPPSTPGVVARRVEMRSLEGMQKEAIVSPPAGSGPCWRLMSDEGPYLNGTDLAPFPLGFFMVGQQFCLMTQVLRLARVEKLPLSALALAQDNYYSMAGSILRGDMTGGAMPADVLVKIKTSAPERDVVQLVHRAVRESPGQAVMRDVLANEFSITLNGEAIPAHGLRQSTALTPPDPGLVFDTVSREPDTRASREAITKVTTAEQVHGVEGGAGSSLQAEQHRTLHVRGDARLREDGLLETTLRLFRPVGSGFRFVGDPGPSAGGDHDAPEGLAYLVAGMAFCYMTQLGRYAHIVKQRIRAMHLVQDAAFDTTGDAVQALPLVTHVFVDADEPDAAVQRLARMGEQTCFLHAAMRASVPSRVHIELNGAAAQTEN